MRRSSLEEAPSREAKEGRVRFILAPDHEDQRPPRQGRLRQFGTAAKIHSTVTEQGLASNMVRTDKELRTAFFGRDRATRFRGPEPHQEESEQRRCALRS